MTAAVPWAKGLRSFFPTRLAAGVWFSWLVFSPSQHLFICFATEAASFSFCQCDKRMGQSTWRVGGGACGGKTSLGERPGAPVTFLRCVSISRVVCGGGVSFGDGCCGSDPLLSFFPQWGSLTSATTAAGATSSAVLWRSTRNAATTTCRMSVWRQLGRSWVTMVGANRLQSSLGLGEARAGFFPSSLLPSFPSLLSQIAHTQRGRRREKRWVESLTLSSLPALFVFILCKSVFHFLVCVLCRHENKAKSPAQNYPKSHVIES